MPDETKWLRAGFAGKPEGVDRKAGTINGYILAQSGPFKSAGRGEFDEASLSSIVSLGGKASKGLKVRLGHPGLSDDGVGKFLGRAQSLRMSTATDARTGRLVKAVRGDLHFDKSAYKTPNGDLASYVMDLAESDSDALSSSLVLEADEVPQLDKKGKPLTDDKGDPLPPLWRPTKLHASDIVDTGDAVDGLLSAKLSSSELDALLRFDGDIRIASFLAKRVTANMSREQAKAKLADVMERLLLAQFGEEEVIETPRLDAYRERIWRMGGLNH